MRSKRGENQCWLSIRGTSPLPKRFFSRFFHSSFSQEWKTPISEKERLEPHRQEWWWGFINEGETEPGTFNLRTHPANYDYIL